MFLGASANLLARSIWSNPSQDLGFLSCFVHTIWCNRLLVGLGLNITNRHPFTPLLCRQGTTPLLLERRWPGSIHSCAAPGSFGKPVMNSTIRWMAKLCLKFLNGVTFGKMPKWLAVFHGWGGIAISTLAPGGNYSPLNFKANLDFLLAFYPFCLELGLPTERRQVGHATNHV